MDQDQWGPRHQQHSPRSLPFSSWRASAWVIIAVALYGIADGGTRHQSTATITGGVCVLTVLALLGLPAVAQRWLLRSLGRSAALTRSRRSRRAAGQLATADPLAGLREAACRAGGGVHLGHSQDGALRFSRGERAILMLGPPRSGKTSAVIIPTLLSHTGPVVATSTKPDVFHATRLSRAISGRLWVFDPTDNNSGTETAGVSLLRWSPVSGSRSWDRALLIARALTTTVGAGVTERSHWSNRAQASLAPMLHAAAIHNLDMHTVLGWVLAHQLDEPGRLLEDERCSPLAFQSLLGIHHTEARERSSILSAAADALAAYTGEHALAAAEDPNFDPDAFVSSQDTIYIHAPAEAQAAVAPLVCGLLSEIRRATYQAHAQGKLAGRVLLALDEAANIAPLEELPQIASEGGGQGLLLLAALQDLSQARARWGRLADGFLTLFGTKLILPGIADTRTLEAISIMLGEYDRQTVSHTRPRASLADWLPGTTNSTPPRASATFSTQRTRVLSAGEISNIPAGRALHLDGVRWELVTLTPAHAREPWRTLTGLSAN